MNVKLLLPSLAYGALNDRGELTLLYQQPEESSSTGKLASLSITTVSTDGAHARRSIDKLWNASTRTAIDERIRFEQLTHVTT
jgi:hypothetical protein